MVIYQYKEKTKAMTNFEFRNCLPLVAATRADHYQENHWLVLNKVNNDCWPGSLCLNNSMVLPQQRDTSQRLRKIR